MLNLLTIKGLTKLNYEKKSNQVIAKLNFAQKKKRLILTNNKIYKIWQSI